MRIRPLLVALALAAGGVMASPAAHAEDPVNGGLFLPTGVTLPVGAELVGVVHAPISENILAANVASRAGRRRLPAPCMANEAWAVTGTALTGYMFTYVDHQTGHIESMVLWYTDDGDFVDESGEGVEMFASKDCATKIIINRLTMRDVSSSPTAWDPHCQPLVEGGEENIEYPGPFTRPVIQTVGFGMVPYFIGPYVDTAIPSANAPCHRTTSLVSFEVDVSYVEKNRGTKVHVDCVRRSWPVTFAPNVGDDPTQPDISWLTVGEALPEESCFYAF